MRLSPITKVALAVLGLLVVGSVVVVVMGNHADPQDPTNARAQNIRTEAEWIYKEATTRLPGLRESDQSECFAVSDHLRTRLEKIREPAMELPKEHIMLAQATQHLQSCIDCVPAADAACEQARASLDAR